MSQTTDPTFFSDFQNYVDRKKTTGINGHGIEDHYVAFHELKEYWMHDRVKNLLYSFNPPVNVDVDNIIEHFLRTFSILAYINRVSWITWFLRNEFSDEKWLHWDEGMPNNFPKHDDGEKLWNEIISNKWIFCPFQFGPKLPYQRPLDPRCILPITVLEKLTPHSVDEEVAVVERVQIHSAYDQLSRSRQDNSTSNSIVFKRYVSHRAKELWENEVAIFTSIKDRGPCDQIVEYYGSFCQNDTYTIMLEYADRGNLLSMMESEEAPSCVEELLRLWGGLAHLFKGLTRIHGLGDSAPAGARVSFILKSIHLDIKPANILVFKGKTDDAFDFTFKLADFGSSHLRKALSSGQDTKGVDRGGTQMYSAVECCRDFRYLGNETLHITSSVDIWSLGCVFSEILVWTTMGKGGVRKYQKGRVSATDQIKSMKGSGYDGCFHDGENTLQCVHDFHDMAKEGRRRWDEITPKIGDLILDTMLQADVDDRLHATQLYRKFSKSLSGNKDHARSSTNGSKETDFSYRQSEEFTDDGIDQDPGEVPANEKARPSDRRIASETPLRPKPPPSTPQRASTSAVRTRDQDSRKKTWSGPPSSSSEQLRRGQSHRTAREHLAPLPQEPEPKSPRPVSPPQAPPARRSSFPTVTVGTVNEWRRAKKAGLKDESNLPGLQDVVGKLRGRDHLFIIDDSKSMRDYWASVEELFQALAYIVKTADPDGLELYFTSDYTKVYKSKDSGPLVDLVKKRAFPKSSGLTGTCNMTLCLDHIIEQIIPSNIENGKPRESNSWLKKIPGQSKASSGTSRPINIYILTDGKWEPPYDSLCGADDSIIRLINLLKEKNKPDSHVALQFIRFGHDAAGKWRLTVLDDMAKSPEEVSNTAANQIFVSSSRDIVDHTQSDGNVWKMLIGSLSPGMDND
ncbi:Protein kinase-like domain containing protein [Rhypophila decipiens]